MNRYLLLLALAFAPPSQADIYKWVDEQGATHYGERPPSRASAQSIETHNTQSSTPAPTKNINGETKQLAEDISKSMMKVSDKKTELDCAKAVENGKYSIGVMLENGRKNYKDGYIDQEKYEEGAEFLKKLKSSISVSDCRSAKGNKKEFYTCVSNPMNIIIACGDKYKPDLD